MTYGKSGSGALKVMLLGAAATWPMAVAAQGEPASTEPAEIIVTATRRAESIQDVPASIAAISSENLDAAGVTSTRGLEQVVPGLVMVTTSTATQPTLRGVGTRGSLPGEESNVAMYIDGVYQPNMNANNFELLNVERVEVLKGPQGTLYGRNATGGAINVVTTKPGDTMVGKFSLSYGRFSEVNAAAYVGVPLSDGLSVDLAANKVSREGYIEDLVRGGTVGERDSYNVRGRIRFRPADGIDIIAAISKTSTKDSSAFSVQPINGNTVGRRENPSVLLPTKPRQYVGDVLPRTGLKQTDFSLQGQFDLGFATLEAVGDYQTNLSYYSSDSDGTTVRGRDINATGDYIDAWSGEARLISKGAGRLDWIVGALYFGSKAAQNPSIVRTLTSTTEFRGRQDAEAYAAYVEATYEPVDGVFLTGGYRYSNEKKTYTSFVNVKGPTVSASFDSWTPRASIRYQINPDANIYFTFSKGFKSGLFNLSSASTTPVRPETITSYEAGLKLKPASWLRTNLSAFVYDYKDLQVSARLAGNTVAFLQNAGVAKIKGIDLDITAYPIDGLSINLSGEYLDSKFKDFTGAAVNIPTVVNGVAVGGNSSIIIDATGKHLIRSPRYTATLGLAYQFEAVGGVIKLGGSTAYNDGFFLEFGNRLHQPAYVLANANVGWWTKDERLGVTLWGENLASEDIVQWALVSGNQDGYSYRPPATYGIRLQGRF